MVCQVAHAVFVEVTEAALTEYPALPFTPQTAPSWTSTKHRNNRTS